MSLSDRLDLIEKKISSEEFRNNTGTANEVGYYVFDYDPKDELIPIVSWIVFDTSLYPSVSSISRISSNISSSFND